MRFRKPQRTSAVAAIVVVLALAVTLFLIRGVMDAVLMIVIVVVLAGTLRRYARVVELYRRRPAPPRQHTDSGLVSGVPEAGEVDGNRTGGASTVHPRGTSEHHGPNRA